MTERAVFWVGVVGMTLGAALFLLMARGASKESAPHHALHVLVVVWAAISYLALALGVGDVQILAEGRTLHVARYVDWFFTTPLLLVALALTALGESKRDPALVGSLVGADLMMIATGLVAAFAVGLDQKWLWWLVSTGAFIAVYALIWGPLRRQAQLQSDVVSRLFTKHAALLGIVWFFYPFVWLAGTTGYRILSPVGDALCMLALDLVAKVAYGLLALASLPKTEPHARHYRPVREAVDTVGPTAAPAPPPARATRITPGPIAH